jgi:hypothetical protein
VGAEVGPDFFLLVFSSLCRVLVIIFVDFIVGPKTNSNQILDQPKVKCHVSSIIELSKGKTSDKKQGLQNVSFYDLDEIP